MIHNDDCETYPDGGYVKAACRAFSTDGTVLGAQIAHAMGTTSEDEITRRGHDELHGVMTGMDEEQADWEADDEAEYVA